MRVLVIKSWSVLAALEPHLPFRGIHCNMETSKHTYAIHLYTLYFKHSEHPQTPSTTRIHPPHLAPATDLPSIALEKRRVEGQGWRHAPLTHTLEDVSRVSPGRPVLEHKAKHRGVIGYLQGVSHA